MSLNSDTGPGGKFRTGHPPAGDRTVRVGMEPAR